MNWFLRRKKSTEDSPLRITQDRETILLQTYDPCSGLVPASYQPPVNLVDFQKDFDAIVQQFLKNADPDQFNASFMEAQILAVQESALEELHKQRAVHQYTIKGELVEIWAATKKAADFKLSQAKKELNAVEHDLAQKVRILHRGTAYDEASIQLK